MTGAREEQIENRKSKISNPFEPVGENNRTSWTLSVVPMGGRHIAHYQGGGGYLMHANSLGSTTQVTDYSGAVVQDQLFYPWGQNWATSGSAEEMRYASLRHRDSETALDPTHFRMFSSTQGRWFSPDPAKGCGANPQNHNRYAYVVNSPTNRTDPRGDQCCDPVFDPFCLDCGTGGDVGGFCDPSIDPLCGAGAGEGYCDPSFGCLFGGFPFFPFPGSPDFGYCGVCLSDCVVQVYSQYSFDVAGYCPGVGGTAAILLCLDVSQVIFAANISVCGGQYVTCLLLTAFGYHPPCFAGPYITFP